MSLQELDEAISHYRSNAEGYVTAMKYISNEEDLKELKRKQEENTKLADWLKELRRYKRLEDDGK